MLGQDPSAGASLLLCYRDRRLHSRAQVYFEGCDSDFASVRGILDLLHDPALRMACLVVKELGRHVTLFTRMTLYTLMDPRTCVRGAAALPAAL